MRTIITDIHEVNIFDIQGFVGELGAVPEKMLVHWGGRTKRIGMRPDSLSAKWIKSAGVWELWQVCLYGCTTRKRTGWGISIYYVDYGRDKIAVEPWMVDLLHPAHPTTLGLA